MSAPEDVLSSKAMWGPGCWYNSGRSESVAAEAAFGGEGVLVCGISGSGWEDTCHWVLYL